MNRSTSLSNNRTDIFDSSNSSPEILTQTCPSYFHGSRSYWHTETTARILIICLSVLSNTVNLGVLARWPAKPRYMLFHQSLAVSSILTSLTGAFSPAAKVHDPTFSTEWPYYVAFVGVTVFHTVSECSYACLSLDRWLSVIRPAVYARINSRRVFTLIIAVYWCLILVPYGTIYVVKRNFFRSTCINGMRSIYFVYQAVWFKVRFQMIFLSTC
ncbi:hypothetical protein BV898_08309 [Hypsibius exemplaris]|uniref:G-protein coupled receptors family 1 profile domain-containing protein n=1 Tax=Hypsibius exemplaris TaxID=2072580 RepID=A0A1W0WQV6_HYPEX|nr:hypothetical protein BV898_08309 [Hypsibius exemplaris]